MPHFSEFDTSFSFPYTDSCIDISPTVQPCCGILFLAHKPSSDYLRTQIRMWNGWLCVIDGHVGGQMLKLPLFCAYRGAEQLDYEYDKPNIKFDLYFVFPFWGPFLLPRHSSPLSVFQTWSRPVCHLPASVPPAEDMAHSLVPFCLLQPPQGPRQHHWALSLSATVSNV